MKIAIGGMISSGKSTLAKRISDATGIPMMEEFDSNDEVFNTLLGWLYEGRENIEMLLQIYFLHSHWLKQRKYNGHFIVDRDIIEHWLFAQHNLAATPVISNMYGGVFHAYMNDVVLPDLYIILDINWKNFKERVFARGRQQEIDNFAASEEYFRGLIANYTEKVKAQCVIYNVPYVVIDTNELTSDEVFDATLLELSVRKLI